MRVGTKLGIASLLLFVCALLLTPIVDGVFAVIAAVLSCVTGLLAASKGNRWWLVVPVLVFVAFGLMLYVGFHAV